MIVHRNLMSKGEELYLSNELVVNHATPSGNAGGLLRERLEWGILFGYVRTKQTSLLNAWGTHLRQSADRISTRACGMASYRHERGAACAI